jgi:hypothetical protein
MENRVTDTIFLIYSSDVLAPLTGGAQGSCPAGPPLNQAMNVGNHLQDHTASQARRTQSVSSLL